MRANFFVHTLCQTILFVFTFREQCKLPPIKGEAVKDDVVLSLDQAYVKFKGKGDEFQKVKVECIYDEWVVDEKPDWVSCSKNENNEIVIEAEQNPLKEERSGTIVISCYGKTVSLTVI